MPAIEKAEVVRHDRPWPGLHVLHMHAPQIAAAAAPGQFVHVRVPGASAAPTAAAVPAHPLLRRPLSVHDADASAGTLSLLFKVRGIGSSILADVEAGNCLDLMGPMGRGFTLPPAAPAGPYLLVGGGVGIAPLVFLARALARIAPGQFAVLFGASCAGETHAALPALEAIAAAAGCRTLVATLDGSAGARGLVTELLSSCGVEPGFVYACGPEPMMAAVASFADARGITGEISLEEHMACGVGACLGCARELAAPVAPERRYAKVCVDGPVFAMGSVLLNAGAPAHAHASAHAPAEFEGGACR